MTVVMCWCLFDGPNKKVSDVFRGWDLGLYGGNEGDKVNDGNHCDQYDCVLIKDEMFDQQKTVVCGIDWRNLENSPEEYGFGRWEPWPEGDGGWQGDGVGDCQWPQPCCDWYVVGWLKQEAKRCWWERSRNETWAVRTIWHALSLIFGNIEGLLSGHVLYQLMVGVVGIIGMTWCCEIHLPFWKHQGEECHFVISGSVEHLADPGK